MAAAGFMTQSYWVGLAGVGVVVFYNLRAWRQSELFPISPESASTAEKVAWWVIVLSVIAQILS